MTRFTLQGCGMVLAAALAAHGSVSAQTAAKPKKEKALKLPEVDAEELQSRLRARIEELRARRKADGRNGQPAKSRQELLETRRKKEEVTGEPEAPAEDVRLLTEIRDLLQDARTK